MHKFNMSFVFHFCILGLTSWIDILDLNQPFKGWNLRALPPMHASGTSQKAIIRLAFVGCMRFHKCHHSLHSFLLSLSYLNFNLWAPRVSCLLSCENAIYISHLSKFVALPWFCFPTPDSGPLHTRGKSRDHEIVRAWKKSVHSGVHCTKHVRVYVSARKGY
jgi:hypothetical protein